MTASQAGNSNYTAAPPVSQPFSIAPATPTVVITWANSSYTGSANSAAAVVVHRSVPPSMLGPSVLTKPV